MIALRKRLQVGREEGFTLIELMVVVLIIAILIAIAIPTFLGARQRAQDRAAQSDLRNALTAAKVWYTDNQTYVATDDDGLTANNLEDLEPSIDFNSTVANADQDTVGYTGAATTFVAVRQSASGTYFCIADSVAAGGGTTYDSSATETDVDTAAECDQASW